MGSTKLLAKAASTSLAGGRNMDALVNLATSSQTMSSPTREIIVYITISCFVENRLFVVESIMLSSPSLQISSEVSRVQY